jgi:DNA-binding CsgD family transcriptional regulator
VREGQWCAQAGAPGEARARGEEVLHRLAGNPDIVLEGMARAVLGPAALTAGDLAEADRQLTRAHEVEELVHNREPASNRFHADHAEAVIGLGELGRAEALIQRMEERAMALPRPWILAVSARSRGLLSAARGDLDQALADYQRALAAHESLDMPAELGRTLLALGRLLRRRNERQRARETLAGPPRCSTPPGHLDGRRWPARSRAAPAAGVAAGRLTPTELHVAELAVAGLRNSEIAARLFLSGKTVAANLSRIYRKLGVRSRTGLAAKMPPQGTAAR